jgi:hypothetical protein
MQYATISKGNLAFLLKKFFNNWLDGKLENFFLVTLELL